jgi:hypothetical protein
MNTFCRGLLTVLVLTLLATPGLTAEPFNELLKRVPEHANVLMVVDVDALHMSSLGVRENWRKKHQGDYLSGVARIPPTVTEFVMAAQMDPRSMSHAWSVGLGQSKEDIAMAQIARREGSTVDKAAGQAVVRSPRNVYFVELAPRILGAMHPANRQELARWLRYAKQNARPNLSAYLQDAVAKKGRAPVVLAFDLTDCLDPQEIRRGLANSPTVVEKKLNVDALAKTVRTLKGGRLTIQVDNSIQGSLQVDLGEPIGNFAAVAKPLLLETLAECGVALDDFDDWKLRTAGTSCILEGPFSTKGLRQLTSVFMPPAARIDNQTSSASVSSSEDSKAGASQRYFRSIETLLGDLSEKQGGKSGKKATWNQVAAWHERAAYQIDQLPMLNVDDELLAYGAKISNMMRGLGQSFRGVDITTSALQEYKTGSLNVYPGSYGYGYGYGYYSAPTWSYNNNFLEVRSVQDKLVIQGQQARVEVWAKILEEKTAVRKKMVQKYQVEF